MAVTESVKKNWIELQKKSNVPVNAIGLKIDPKDENSMKAWRDEGMEDHLAR